MTRTEAQREGLGHYGNHSDCSEKQQTKAKAEAVQLCERLLIPAAVCRRPGGVLPEGSPLWFCLVFCVELLRIWNLFIFFVPSWELMSSRWTWSCRVSFLLRSGRQIVAINLFRVWWSFLGRTPSYWLPCRNVGVYLWITALAEAVKVIFQ